MEIVVDTNVIISALLRKGVTRKILFLAPFEFYSLSYAKLEIEKHKKELIKKSKLEDDAFQYLLDTIFDKIQVFDLNTIEPYKNKAIEIMTAIDISDAPFIALALHLECSIWSNDKHFKKQQLVKVYTTDEIEEMVHESNGRKVL